MRCCEAAPSPSAPKLFSPQQYAVPSVVSAHGELRDCTGFCNPRKVNVAAVAPETLAVIVVVVVTPMSALRSSCAMPALSDFAVTVVGKPEKVTVTPASG